MTTQSPPVAIIMGSQSDWPVMRAAAAVLDELGVAYEARVISAHRTPDRLYAFAKSASDFGLQSDRCGRRRRGPSSRHDSGFDDSARAGRAHLDHGA